MNLFYLPILARIGIAELGFIIYIAVLLFGFTAVKQNPILVKKEKIVWFIIILVLNWIGLLWYYYVFYIKDKRDE